MIDIAPNCLPNFPKFPNCNSSWFVMVKNVVLSGDSTFPLKTYFSLWFYVESSALLLFKTKIQNWDNSQSKKTKVAQTTTVDMAGDFRTASSELLVGTLCKKGWYAKTRFSEFFKATEANRLTFLFKAVFIKHHKESQNLTRRERSES